jgi:hypothetical protein
MRPVSRRSPLVIAACIGAVHLSAGADLPHIGRWKLNPAKSNFGGLTLTFAATAPGTIRRSLNGGPFSTSSLDGKDVPIHSGYTSSSRQLDDHTWSSTTKLNGAVISTDRIQLSEDNQALVVTSTGTQPDGKSFRNRLTYTRTSGKTGLVGTWRAAAVSESEQVIESVRRADGVTLIVQATKATCEARIDGGDYPLKGPTMAAGATLSFTQTAVRSIAQVQKQNGRVIARSTLTVSTDGTTLTESVLAADGNSTQATKVYDRQ